MASSFSSHKHAVVGRQKTRQKQNAQVQPSLILKANSELVARNATKAMENGTPKRADGGGSEGARPIKKAVVRCEARQQGC